MGFWPFAWSWRTKGGGRVLVGGFILTPALLGLNWWYAKRHGRQQQMQIQLPPSMPEEQERRQQQWIQGDSGMEFLGAGQGQQEERGDGKGF